MANSKNSGLRKIKKKNIVSIVGIYCYNLKKKHKTKGN